MSANQAHFLKADFHVPASKDKLARVLDYYGIRALSPDGVPLKVFCSNDPRQDLKDATNFLSLVTQCIRRDGSVENFFKLYDAKPEERNDLIMKMDFSD